MRAFFLRFAKDERGSHTTEMALAIALFALIAGFGFFAFGDALADFFAKLGDEFQNARARSRQAAPGPIGCRIESPLGMG
jgi:Flp pilus assembly pilin Flp